jgi:succinyl-diaminopimelate desuccinylase
MKGSLAAMISATEAFVDAHPGHLGSIGFLITSDEEGPAVDGTARVVDLLEARGEKIDYCLIGEPTSAGLLGDTIKNGRRGSLTGWLRVHGKQGHVAYPHLAKNPLHAFSRVLFRLCEEHWDNGNEFFPPTTFQIANLHMGTGADNVIPGELEAQFNFRFSTELDAEGIRGRVSQILGEGDFTYDLSWRLSGNPFLTAPGTLVSAVREAVQTVTGITPALSTSGGTSDGRFIAPTGAQVVELGPRNATIHQLNECVGVDELEQLRLIYQRLLENLLT